MWKAILSIVVALLKLAVEYAAMKRRLNEQERALAEDAHERALKAAKAELAGALESLEAERREVEIRYEEARRRRNPGG